MLLTEPGFAVVVTAFVSSSVFLLKLQHASLIYTGNLRLRDLWRQVTFQEFELYQFCIFTMNFGNVEL